MPDPDDRTWDLYSDSLLRTSDDARRSWLVAITSTITMALFLGPRMPWTAEVTVLGTSVPKYLGCLCLSLLIVGSLLFCLHSLRRGNKILQRMLARPNELEAVSLSGLFFVHVDKSPRTFVLTRPLLEPDVSLCLTCQITINIVVGILLLAAAFPPGEGSLSIQIVAIAICSVIFMSVWMLTSQVKCEHRDIEALIRGIPRYLDAGNQRGVGSEPATPLRNETQAEPQEIAEIES
ncbi:hypothetical protein [Roseimaritima multifibrata]|nr:hypothetical protein [Roseimaritima multifibrata]